MDSASINIQIVAKGGDSALEPLAIPKKHMAIISVS